MTQEQEHEILFVECYLLDKILKSEMQHSLSMTYCDYYEEVCFLLKKLGLLNEYELWKIKNINEIIEQLDNKTGGNKNESKEMG